MKKIVDILNFNADASCLSTSDWLKALDGGKSSQLSRWLNLYITKGKKIVLGFTGATIADIAVRNPQSIAVINEHPETFQVILRPFAHDIALLRTTIGFSSNFLHGERTIRKEFSNVHNFFLPPEFMVTNEQLMILHERGVEGVFVNPERFSEDMRRRIPDFPYTVLGLFGCEMPCIPFRGKLTEDYLLSLHMFDPAPWNRSLQELGDEPIFIWRDGESSFLFPEGFARETHWLEGEDKKISREHLGTSKIDFLQPDCLPATYYRPYPVHSFTVWMKEFRMLGFLNRIGKIEASLDLLSEEGIHYWLMTINSDILSAIEKPPPCFPIRQDPVKPDIMDLTLHRSERGFEGEEYLAILERFIASGKVPDYVVSSNAPHIERFRNRLDYLNTL